MLVYLQVTDKDSYTLSSEQSASILIITEGQGEISNLGQVKSGHVLFIPANEECSISLPNKSIVMHRALCMAS